ncbi:hypothetical protein Gogos_016814, partial [Gossypium gossypioides]|nr:hypothetical protein [Gossypium gossypioides]
MAMGQASQRIVSVTRLIESFSSSYLANCTISIVREQNKIFCYNIQSDFEFGILIITNPTQNFTCRHLAVPLEEPLSLFPKITSSMDCLDCLDVPL